MKEIKMGTFTLGAITYVFLTPTYINIFVIYAFCNMHDISWGNRPTTASAEDKKMAAQKSEYEVYRSDRLFVWMIYNAGVGYFLTYFARNDSDYLAAIALIIGIFMVFRLLLAFIFQFRELFNKGALDKYIDNNHVPKQSWKDVRLGKELQLKNKSDKPEEN
jgi:hypothetical protein